MKGRQSDNRYPESIHQKVYLVALGREKEAVRLSEEEMGTLGHVEMSAAKAIRLMCIDCMGAEPPNGGWRDIELCTSVGCPLWPFRFGVTPWGKKASRAKARILERSEDA